MVNTPDDDNRCRARAKSTGERCKYRAAPGATVCRYHGAAAPQVRRKAAERVAFATMQRMVANAGVDLDPIEHLLDSLTRVAQLVAVYGAMVADRDNASEVELQDTPGVMRGEVVPRADKLLALNREGLATLHPYVVEYHRLIESRAKLAKLALDAGVAERRVKIVEQQVEMTQEALEAALEELGLTRDQRQAARLAVAEHLRAAE